MNFTNAQRIVIDGKTVQQISIDGEIVYASGPIIKLTADKSYILANETVHITLTCAELPFTDIRLYEVINMTKTLIDTLTTDENGQASYTYEGTGGGQISFVAEYEDSSSNTVIVDDYVPAVTNISLIADTYSFNYGGSVTLTATVKDQHDQALSGQTVTFKNGSTSLGSGTTDSNGIATLTKSGLNAGSYSITAESGNVSSTAISIEVNKLNTVLTLDTPVLVYSDEFSVTGELTDSNGNGIVGATVKLEWNDGTAHTNTAETTTGGEVIFHRDAPTTITEYGFKLVYDASTNYNATESSQVNVTVEKETSVLNVTSPTSGAAITGSTFSVAGTLKDNDNTAMANKDVLVKLGTSTLSTLTTDSSGAFTGSVSSSGLSDGSNTLNFVFVEDNYYTGATQQVNVSKTSFDGISLSVDKSILSKVDNEYATLSAQLTISGSPASISGQAVTFEVRKSSDDSLVTTLSGDTNSSGIASVSYASQGVGDVKVQAFCGSFVTETYTVQDYLQVPSLNGDNIYQISGTTTVSNGEMGGGSAYLSLGFDNTGDWELTCKVKFSGSNCCLAVFPDGETSRDSNELGVQGYNTTTFWNVNGVYNRLYDNGRHLSYNTYYTLVIKKENGAITTLIDGVSRSPNWSPSVSSLHIGVGGWGTSGNVCTIKEIVVKPL